MASGNESEDELTTPIQATDDWEELSIKSTDLGVYSLAGQETFTTKERVSHTKVSKVNFFRYYQFKKEIKMILIWLMQDIQKVCVCVCVDP